MQGKVQQILDEVGKVIRGKDEAIRLVHSDSCQRTYFDRRHPRGGKNNFGGGVFPGYGADGETSAVYP